MGDCQHCTVFKLFSDNLLDDGIVFDINVSSGFIYKYDFAMLEKSSADAEQLFFTCRQTVVRDRGIKPTFFHDSLIEIAFFEYLV